MEPDDYTPLVQAAQRGDREAFGRLVERHQDMIMAVCYRIAGNVPDAEDLAHDTFVEAFLKIGQLAQPPRFAGWLRTIARNVSLMWLRRQVPTEALAEEPPAPIDDEPEATLADMTGAITALPAAQRLILALHYWEGLPYEELARFLDVPIGTVMSRLYRARQAVKEEMMKTDDEKEPTMMIHDTGFLDQVDAEIGVLLGLGQDRREPAERLRVILERSPDRVARLIRETADEGLLANLGTVLPRLGPPAVRCVLQCYASGDVVARARATVVLRHSVAGPDGGANVPVWAGTPTPYAYHLADGIVAAPLADALRAELLVELLEAAGDGETATLLTCLLMCWRLAAFGALWERFRNLRQADELYRRPYAFYALLRTGTPLWREIAGRLASRDPAELAVALGIAQGLAESFEPDWLRPATPEQYADTLRRKTKWPPVVAKQLDAAVLPEMRDRLTTLLDHPDVPVWNAAIRTLGLLRDAGSAPALRRLASHADQSTRIAAIMALGELGDGQAGEVIMTAARSGQPAVRTTALEVLSRLKLPHALPLLQALLKDPEAQIRAAAATALGELGGEEAAATLRELLGADDKGLARVAAKALYRGHRGSAAPSAQEQRLRELGARRERKVRGEANVVGPWHAGPDTAIRFAFAELRAYIEPEVTHLTARVCGDHPAVRRRLIESGFMTRESGVYRFTELGAAAWRVEHFILDRYLMPAARAT